MEQPKEFDEAVSRFEEAIKNLEEKERAVIENKLKETAELLMKIEARIALRSCGECRACCTNIAVEELGKPIEQPCAHECAAGCSIYERRPQLCRDFYCLWRSGSGRLMERPDRVGYFLHTTSDIGKFRALIAREAYPGAFDRADVLASLDNAAKRDFIIRVRGKERKLLGPAHLMRAAAKVDIQSKEPSQPLGQLMRSLRTSTELRKQAMGRSHGRPPQT